MRRYGLVALVFSLIGFSTGWFLKPDRAVEPEPQPVAINIPAREKPASSRSLPPTAANPLSYAISDVMRLIDSGRFEAAYESLLQAATQANTPVEQEELTRLLGALVDGYTKALAAINQYERMDEFYEQLTLDLPQHAQYQLQLGKLRIQMGNGSAALLPLAQISNHPQFGAQARSLIARIEENEARSAFVELPLTGTDGQFVVEALIDQRLPIRLLVDTGAAMTAIDADFMRRAGYDLVAEQQYFATANGVVAAPVLTLETLSLGDAAISELAIGALPLALPKGVSGLLGMNFLRHYDFQIDQNSRTLILDRR